MSSHLVIECSNCHSRLTVWKNTPTTYSCQKCGSSLGTISGEGDLASLYCLGCKKTILLPLNKKTNLVCTCGRSVFSFKFFGEFSSISVGEPKQIEPFFRPLKKGKLKILIPYFEGNPLVERAVQTWIYPEVVFGLTDPEIIPPGLGICSQLFSPKNATSIKGVEKTKPFLIDFLSRMLKLFPNEEYYGFFNSDAILPPGQQIESLLPSSGKKIAIFHRLDVPPDNIQSLTGEGTSIFVGKDGFVCDRETMKKIIHGYPDAVIGAPTWDSALTVWAWTNLGKEKVELRYDEIWHAKHKENWKYTDPDAIHNAGLFSMSERERLRIDWNGVMKESEKAPCKFPRIGIIQPGRIGDILIVLPIAKWYHDAGYRVHWPVASEYVPLFDYINYVKVHDIGELSYQNAKSILYDMPILNLSIGFGDKELDDRWKASGLSFDEWKYQEANVPFHNKYNLSINRDFKKEEKLKKLLNLSNRYVVTHSVGTNGSFDFGVPNAVEVKPIEGFTLFDWIGILEGAGLIACVDSCVANLVEQMDICYGRRFVHFWGNGASPVLGSDWGTPKEFLKKVPDPKISFLMIVWNGMPFVEPCLEAIYDRAHEIFVVEGAVPESYDQAKEDGSSTDETVSVIKQFPDPKGKITFAQGRWGSRKEMNNYFVDKVTGDYVWVVDSDEIWKEKDLNMIIDLLKKRPNATEVRFFAYHFFKGFDYHFEDKEFFSNGGIRRVLKYKSGAVFESHNPPTLLYKDGSLSNDSFISAEETSKLGIFYYHYTYIYDHKMREKVQMYDKVPHFGGTNHTLWYEKFFSKWTPENREEVERNGFGPWPLSPSSCTKKFEGEHPIPIQKRMEKLKLYKGGKL